MRGCKVNLWMGVKWIHRWMHACKQSNKEAEHWKHLHTYNKRYYHIDGNIGEELILMNWRFTVKSPIKKSANNPLCWVWSCACGDVGVYWGTSQQRMPWYLKKVKQFLKHGGLEHSRPKWTCPWLGSWPSTCVYCNVMRHRVRGPAKGGHGIGADLEIC